MKKLITIGLLMIFALVAGVFAAPDINVISTNINMTGNVSSTLSTLFTISNTGTDPAYVTFSDYTLTNSGYSLDITPISMIVVNAGDTKNVSVQVTTSSNQIAGTYSGNLNMTVRYQNSTFVEYESIPAYVTINQKQSITTTDETENVVAGTNANLNFTVTNTGNVDLTGITIWPQDLTSGSETLTPVFSSQLFNLNYNSSSLRTFTVNVPSTKPAGTYTGTFYVTHASGINESVDVSLTVSSQTKTVSLSSAATEITKGIETSDTAQLNVTNTGNTALSNVVITVGNLTYGSEVIESSKISVSPSTVTSIAPGAKSTVVLTVTPDSNQAVGTYTGTVTATYNAGNTTTSTLTVEIANAKKELTAGDVTLGGTGSSRNTSYSITATVKNTGDYTLTGLAGTISADAKYGLNFTGLASSLASGAQDTFTINGMIPANEASGSHNIGVMKIEAGDGTNVSFNIKADPQARLEITEVEIDVEGDDETVSQGENIDNIEPGDSIKVTVEISNQFPDNSDIDIDDITVDFTVFDFEDEGDDDLEMDENDITIREGKDKKVTFSFDVPMKIEDGTYDVQIDVEGDDDEYDSTHKDSFTFTIEIEKPSDRVRIIDSGFRSSTLSCSRTTYLDISVLNLGTDDQDDCVLTVRSDELGLDEIEYFELTNEPYESDSEYEKSYFINAEKLKTGTYNVDVKVYREKDDLEDVQKYTLIVRDCSTGTTPGTNGDDDDKDDDDDQTGSSGIDVNTGNGISTPGTSGQDYSRPATGSTVSGGSLSGSGWYLAILIIGVVVALALVVILLVQMVRK